MGGDDFRRMLQGVRARLENAVGRDEQGDDWRAPLLERWDLRRGALVSAVIFAYLAVAVAGYAIGASRGVELDSVLKAATAAGDQRGRAEGRREGYASAFGPARERAYDAAYRKAYRLAFREEFARVDVSPPSRVKVGGP